MEGICSRVGAAAGRIGPVMVAAGSVGTGAVDFGAIRVFWGAEEVRAEPEGETDPGGWVVEPLGARVADAGDAVGDVGEDVGEDAAEDAVVLPEVEKGTAAAAVGCGA